MKTPACLIILATLSLAGCVPDQEIAYENPPVGMLVSNGHQITIHSGEDGPLYTVRGPGGERLAREITKDELQASFPELEVGGIWAEASSASSLEKNGPILAD